MCVSSFWQCEWTGLPMRAAHCYWPVWSTTDKLVKKGSYCNWEAVIAHALYLLEKKQLTAEQHERVVEHVHGIVGTVVDPAPHYEQLVHTKGHMSAIDFHRSCAAQTHPVSAVKISPDGQVFELLLYPKEGTFSFEDYLHKPFTFHAPPSTFHSMRKKGQKGDRDLSVWHYAAKDLLAEDDYEMQLMGPPLILPPNIDPTWCNPRRPTRARTAPLAPILQMRNQFDALAELLKPPESEEEDPPEDPTGAPSSAAPTCALQWEPQPPSETREAPPSPPRCSRTHSVSAACSA